MKKFKKLIPALCMLLVSAVMLGSTTFAWFSMNTTVTASGMKVEAKSDAKFLQIKNTGAWNDTDAFTSVTLEAAKKSIYPTMPVKAIAEDNKSITPFDGTTLVWVSTYSTDPSDATAGVGTSNNYTKVTDTVEDNYALKVDFTVRLKPNSGAAEAANLKVTNVKFTATTQNDADITDGLSSCLRVLFVCGENKVVWKDGAYVVGKADSILANKVTTTDLTVTAYVYYDGSDSNCVTNKALTPDEYSLEFTLGVA